MKTFRVVIKSSSGAILLDSSFNGKDANEVLEKILKYNKIFSGDLIKVVEV